MLAVRDQRAGQRPRGRPGLCISNSAQEMLMLLAHRPQSNGVLSFSSQICKEHLALLVSHDRSQEVVITETIQGALSELAPAPDLVPGASKP